MEPSVRTFTLLLLMFLPMHSNGFPNGQVQPACTTMVPQHGFDPQNTAPPYKLELSTVNHTGILGYKVTLMKVPGGSDFKGFMIQARAPDSTTPQGRFMVDSTEALAQTLNCNTNQDTVSHTSPSLKPKVSVIWLPPMEARTDIQFRATVVEARNTFWTGLDSEVSRIASGGPQLLAPVLSQLLLFSTVLIYTQFTI